MVCRGDGWKGREIIIPDTHKICDMAFKKDELTIIVEFDGDARIGEVPGAGLDLSAVVAQNQA